MKSPNIKVLSQVFLSVCQHCTAQKTDELLEKIYHNSPEYNFSFNSLDKLPSRDIWESHTHCGAVHLMPEPNP